MTKKTLALFLIISLSLFFRLYHLNDRYIFERDQSDDAYQVMNMLSRGLPLLIGPRVANEDTFFVGPYHYYFLSPFYLATKGDPIAGAYASIAIGLITSVVAFLVINNFFGIKAAIIGGVLFAISPSLVCWNAMYGHLFSLLFFYFAFQIISENKVKFFPLLSLSFSLGITTHLGNISLILPFVFISLYCLFRSKNPGSYVLATVFFLLPFLTIFIFDLRHNFFNFTKLLEFIGNKNSSYSNPPPLLFINVFWRSLNFLSISSFASFLILLLGFFSFSEKKQKILILTIILSPLLLLSVYKGNISEYYYASVASLVPLFYAKLAIQPRISQIFSVLMIVIFLVKSNILLNDKQLVSLQTKKNLVTYLVNQSSDLIFNVSYDLPPGWNHGYSYLFNFYGREPQDIPQAHLYTIFELSHRPEGGEIVYQHSPLGILRR